MRLIDADKLKENFNNADACGLNLELDRYAIKCIDNAPTIDPVRHGYWVPCGERLPKDDSWVIVTVLDERGDTPFRYTDFGWYLEAASCWIVDAEQRTDVTAWMPLPKPYRKGSRQ